MELALKVIGYESGEFTDEKTGDVIRYAKVHAINAIEENGQGMKPVTYKAKPEAVGMLRGQKLPADYNAVVTMTPRANGQFAVRVDGFRL